MFIGGVLGASCVLVSSIPPSEEYTMLEIDGEINVDNVCVRSETLTQTEMEELTEQTWVDNTILMLADYENTLEAGNLRNSGKPVTHWRIRRRRPNEALATLLCEIPFSYDNTSFTDYSPRNLVNYIYSLYAVSYEDGLAMEGEGAEVTAMSDWYGWILESDYISPATPVSQFLFDINNKSGDISVKRGMNFYENYSQYKAVRFDDRNYSEGSFETLPYELSNTSNDVDTTLEILEEIVAFINDKQIKILRNSKGNLWKVVTYDCSYQLMDNIIYTVDGNERHFPATLKWSWCEVASE